MKELKDVFTRILKISCKDWTVEIESKSKYGGNQSN